MEEQKKDENLPVVIKERSLSNFVQIAKNKLYDAGRRGVKIAGATTLAVTGLGHPALHRGQEVQGQDELCRQDRRALCAVPWRG